MEERGWRRSLGEVQSTEGVLSIQLESEDRWYARPGGLLLIGFIITIIGGVIVVMVEQTFFSR